MPPLFEGTVISDPVHLARTAGKAKYRRSGEIWYPELELAFIPHIFRRVRCDKDAPGDQKSDVRLRRNLLLVGPKGSGKTTMSKKFLIDLAGFVNYSDVDRGDERKPTYLEVDGGGASWQKRRGGAIDGNLVFPSLHDVNVLFSGELASFLGGVGEKVRGMMEVLNPALEEGNITIDQMGMANVKATRKAAFEEMCHGTKVRYNSEKDTMSYEAGFSLISSTRQMESKKAKETWEILDDSGFLSRNHISEWLPSEKALDAYSLDKFGKPDEWAERELRAFNDYAWKCRFKFVPPPPLSTVNDLVAHYHDIYAEASRDTGTPISELRSDRDHTDICQLLVIFAAIRQIEAARAAGAAPQEFERIDYLPEDADAIRKFRTYHFDMVSRRAVAKAKDDKLRDVTHDALIAYLTPKWHVESDIEDITRGDLAKYLMMKLTVSKPTAYNRIDKMLTCGFIEAVDRKHYRVAASIIADLGIEVESEAESDAGTDWEGRDVDPDNHALTDKMADEVVCLEEQDV